MRSRNKIVFGAPGRTRTCNPRLRRPMLYPVKLQAHVSNITAHTTFDIEPLSPKLSIIRLRHFRPIKNWSGWRDSNPRHPAPKAGALPNCATPRHKTKASQKQSANNTQINSLGQRQKLIFILIHNQFILRVFHRHEKIRFFRLTESYSH